MFQQVELPFSSLFLFYQKQHDKIASGIDRNDINRGRAAPEIDNTVNRRTVVKDPPASILD